MTEKLNHARVPRRFYILTLLIFVPIFYCLLAIRAHWYGWAIAVVAFAGLVAIRRSRYQQAAPGEAASVYKNGELVIDYAAGCASMAGREIHLTPIEYRLLCLLASNAVLEV